MDHSATGGCRQPRFGDGELSEAHYETFLTDATAEPDQEKWHTEVAIKLRGRWLDSETGRTLPVSHRQARAPENGRLVHPRCAGRERWRHAGRVDAPGPPGRIREHRMGKRIPCAWREQVVRARHISCAKWCHSRYRWIRPGHRLQTVGHRREGPDKQTEARAPAPRR